MMGKVLEKDITGSIIIYLDTNLQYYHLKTILKELGKDPMTKDCLDSSQKDLHQVLLHINHQILKYQGQQIT